MLPVSFAVAFSTQMRYTVQAQREWDVALSSYTYPQVTDDLSLPMHCLYEEYLSVLFLLSLNLRGA